MKPNTAVSKTGHKLETGDSLNSRLETDCCIHTSVERTANSCHCSIKLGESVSYESHHASAYTVFQMRDYIN